MAHYVHNSLNWPSTGNTTATQGISEMLAKCKEFLEKLPKPVVLAVSKPVFDDLSPEHQKLYLEEGNHVIDVQDRFAYDVTGIVKHKPHIYPIYEVEY